MYSAKQKSFVRIGCLVALAALAFALPELAAAQSSGTGGLFGSSGCDSAIFKGLNGLVQFLNGGVARAVAILAVMAFGIGALTGRVDWIKALQIVLAVGIIFAAAAVVDTFTGGTAVTCAVS